MRCGTSTHRQEKDELEKSHFLQLYYFKVLILSVHWNKFVREPLDFTTKRILEITQQTYFAEGKLRQGVQNYSFKTGLNLFSSLLGQCSIHYMILPSPLLELGNPKYVILGRT